mgnify:CR=1 FL=1|tara:strand:- start:6188 stop:6421 length:234 start_codon:yes stop_codon:yes gene_type:complete
MKNENKTIEYLMPNRQISLESTIKLYEKIKKKKGGFNVGIEKRLKVLYGKRNDLYEWQEQPYSVRRYITSPAVEFLT